MGNHQGSQEKENSSLRKATDRAEGRLGKQHIQGRYHRLPKQVSDDYTVDTKALGTGYSGAVLLAHSKHSGQKYAIKAFKLHGVTSEKKKELVSECEIFLGMDHPHVARLVDVYEGRDELSLVMECMEGGELFDRIVQRKVFSEKDAAATTHQMLLAVNYIHSMNVVHRDLKLENFLYEKKNSDFLKLIDFGFSKIWDKNTKMELSCGTLAYVAPEVLAKSYTSQCDMWSLGVIVFILLVGYMPFVGTSEKQQIANIRTGKYNWREDKWKNVSADGAAFVKNLLVVDQKARLTSDQALAHTWIEKRSELQDSRRGSFDESCASALTSFARESQFRRAVMQLMAWSLTAEERANVRDAFMELDKDNTGTISLVELRKVLEDRFHTEDAECSEVFEALDSNSDGILNYSEFLAAMCSSRLKLHDDLLKATFRRFDTSNTGYVTAEDFKKVLGDDIPVDEWMKTVDGNSDGQVSYEEFIAYLRNQDDTRQIEAGCKVIDHALTPVDELQRIATQPECSPTRIRKRDRLKQLGRQLIAPIQEMRHSASSK